MQTAYADRLRQLIEREFPLVMSRFNAGQLYEEDLRALLRAFFFASFDRCATKYLRITAKDLNHPATCMFNDARIRYSSASVHFSQIPHTPERLAVVTALLDCQHKIENAEPHAQAICTVDLKEHQGQCPCGAHVTRYSAHVTISFANYTIAREYALAAPIPS